MAATPFHDQDNFDPRIQRIEGATEFTIYGPTGGVGTDDNIRREFLDGFGRPRNCALAYERKKGLTMVQLADLLGTNHGTISRWYHQGILPASLESFLMACPGVSAGLGALEKKVFNARHRMGFMFVARYLFGKMPGRSMRKAQALSELHAELLFEILHLDERARWERMRLSGNTAMAQEVVHSVCDEPDRETIPPSLNQKQIRRAQRLISRLRGNDRFAFRYLCFLHRRWEGVFTLTRSAVEGMGWL